MSNKKMKDYRKVLKKIMRLLPNKPSVVRVVVDFEQAMWGAIRDVLPDVSLKGCVFHWTQAVWRKIQELGLAGAYSQDDGMHNYLRKLMALPFLPATEIPGIFTRLRLEANSDALSSLAQYISNTWVYGKMFTPIDWRVYGQAIRTNNDIEGWHNALNCRASGRVHLPFYLLVKLLHQEAELAAIHVRLVSQRKLSRVQRKKYRSLQAKIFALWEDYEQKKKTPMELLKSCSFLNGPIRQE